MRLRQIGNKKVSRMAFIALLFMAMAAFHLAPSGAQAAQATLSWSAPTTYTDGTPLTSLSGYTVHAGTARGSYTQNISVGQATSYTLSSLSDATTYYFAVSATDASGNASKPSNEVAFTTAAAPAPIPLYTLSASAGSGGTITPSGSLVVSKGASQSFTITSGTGYKIADVTVDGVSVGAVASYAFSNIAAGHKIAASFASATTSTPAPATGSWQNQAITPQSGTFTALFDMTPGANKIDAVAGFAPVQAKGYPDMAAIVRFNNTGNIDARNGGAYTARVAYTYAAGKTYRVRMVVNVSTHSYDVYVAPQGGTETQLAAGYAFRTEQATASTLTNFTSYAGTGTQQVANLSVTAATATFAPATISQTWQNKSITPQSGIFTASFDLVPNANNIDAVTGLSQAEAKAYGDMAAIVRFNNAGNIDARNGGAYTARVAYPYAAGKTYRVRMVVNVPTHRYDVYVAPQGGTETQLAAGYAFRTEQATASTLTNFTSYAGTGTQQVANLSVTAATTTFAPMTSSSTWQNKTVTAQSGTFTARFDLVPGANNINAVTGLSPVLAKGYGDMAAIVRLNDAGRIDARNGSTYAARVSIPYAAGKVYKVRMVVNVPTRRYDVYVTPPGGAETQLAAGYAFRTEQASASSLNNVTVFAGTGSHQLSNLSLQ